MINLVTALEAEADPLIDRFGLRRDQAIARMRLFEGSRLSLVISGVGREAARTAVGRLHELVDGTVVRSWLNVGLAGHALAEVGDGFLAARIEDAESGRAWSPTIGFKHRFSTATVRTVVAPEELYAADVLYDMEAAGFYEAALRVSPPERVYVFKVVSDNRRQPARRVSGKLARRLIENRLPDLERLLAHIAHQSSASRAGQ